MSLKYALKTLCLQTGGIEYFWIIRVFILVAIAAPLLLQLYQKLQQNQTKFLWVLLGIYLGYEVILGAVTTLEAHSVFQFPQLIKDYIFYAIPYSCLYGLGMVLPQLNQNLITKVVGILL